jgi:hypothetical protein
LDNVYLHNVDILHSTTTAGPKGDEPERKIYRRHAENVSLVMLLPTHKRNLFEHARQGKLRVLPAPKNIAGVAKAIDEFLARSTGEG